MRIEGIICDSGYVIYDDMPGKRANHEAVRRFREMSYEEFLDVFVPFKNRAQVDAAYSGENALADCARELGLDAEKVLSAHSEQKYVRVVREGVRETLEEIQRRGIPFLILSDTNQTAARMREKYHRQLDGLDLLITDFITSKDTGLRKPDPGMFRAACERIREELTKDEIDPGRVAFIAHDLDEIEGGYRYGVRPLVVYYHGRREDITFVPDTDMLTDVADLIRVLDGSD